MKLTISLLALLFSFTLAEDTLKFSKKGTFKILHLTDIHFGENEDSDVQTINLIKDLLSWEKPDIVVNTGDVVSGYAWDGTTRPWAKTHYMKLEQAFEGSSVKFITTAGNHDNDADLTREEIYELDRSLNHSMTGENQVHAIKGQPFNYIVPIYNANGTQIVTRIWMLDSGSNGCLANSGWGCVLPEQVAWFRNATLEIPKDVSKGRGFLFMHIPLPEYLMLYNEGSYHGFKGEDICCSSVNTGLFSAIQESENIDWVMTGHDHDNDFYGDVQGIKLGFGRKTGKGGYGPEYLLKGARVYELSVDPDTLKGYKVNTYIRESDGSIDLQSGTSSRSGLTSRQGMCCKMELNKLRFLKE